MRKILSRWPCALYAASLVAMLAASIVGIIVEGVGA